MLSRDQILSADDRKRQEVGVPEWGGSVHVRVMSASERDKFEAAFLADKSKDVRARIAAYVICDEAGAPLFSEADIPALGAKSAAALDRVFSVAMRINKLSDRDIEELAKN